MRKVRVYIADMDSEFVAQVRKVCASRGIEIVGNAPNGRAALMDIARLRPDVLITDIPLPGLDGIGLIRETRRGAYPPVAIACTRFYSPASMECACKYGAAFFLCKPVDLASLPELILMSAGNAGPGREQPARDAECAHDSQRRAMAARELLREIGLSPKLDGSAYILEAAQHASDSPFLLKNLSRGLYAELARRMDSTVPRVERSLRSAIAIAYERGCLGKYFASRPSNRAFIGFFLREVDRRAAEARTGGLDMAAIGRDCSLKM